VLILDVNRYPDKTSCAGKVEESQTLRFQNTSTCNNQTADPAMDVPTAAKVLGNPNAQVTYFASSTVNSSSDTSISTQNSAEDTSLDHQIQCSANTVQPQCDNGLLDNNTHIQYQHYDTSNGVHELDASNQNCNLDATSEHHFQTIEGQVTFTAEPQTSVHMDSINMQYMEVNSTPISVMDANRLSEMCNSQNPDSRSLTPSDFAFRGQSVMSFMNQNMQADSEVSQDSSIVSHNGPPRGALHLSHLLQAAAASASPFSDQIESPMSETIEIGDNRWQQSTPDPEQGVSGHRQKAGPRRKKTWLIDDDDEDKEPLNSELRNGLRILKEIMSDINKSVNWPFMEPVDAKDAPEYYDRIESPMWLRKSKYALLFS
jgi:hypothetical protein